MAGGAPLDDVLGMTRISRASTRTLIAAGARAAALLVVLGGLGLGGCDCGDGETIQQLAPRLSATPNPLAYGEIFLGFTAGKGLVLANVGSAELDVTSVTVKPGSHPGLSVDAFSGKLAPSAQTTVVVRLTADALGPVTGAIIVLSNDPTTPTLEIPVVASAARRPGPALSVCVESADAMLARTCVDPLSVELGLVPSGTTRRATVTVASVGDLPLQVRGVDFVSGSDPEFTRAPALAESLAPGQERRVEVTFAPTREDSFDAVLEVLSDDPDRERVPVIFHAGGVTAALCADPTSVDYGTVPRGQVVDRTITLTACGRAPVELTGVDTMGAEFTVTTSVAVPVTLAMGESRRVDVRYAPADLGRDQGMFRARSSGGDVLVPLTGQTEACDLTALPASLSFGGVGAGRSRSLNVVVSNAGRAACTVSAVTLTGSGEFRLPAAPTVPRTLAPGAVETLAVEYAPTDTMPDMGNLVLASDDPAEPMLSVPLSGRRLEAGECELTVVPDPISFGVVTLGMSRRLGATVTNAGASSCTLASITVSVSSDPDFIVTQTPVIPILLPGRTAQIEVEFRPTDAGARTGVLEISTSVLMRTPPTTVNLDGSGAGARLCVSPDTVLFGTHPVGAPTDRTLALTACGTVPSVVSRLELMPPTSTEFQVVGAPALPLTIPSGSTVNVTLRHTGSAVGRDEGRIEVASNDQVEPVQEALLIAAAGTGCGDLSGRICGLDGSGPAAGVTVYVNTPAGRQSATTDAAGDYYLTCIPGGTYQVTAESGSWSTQFSAMVTDGRETSVSGQNCLDPNSAEVAVVWGEWDQIQNILTTLNVPHTFYGENDQADLLEDLNELMRYDVVFLNCGFDELLVTSGTGLMNLRTFVAMGGSVYASDWAYDAIEIAWPSFVDYHQDDAVPNDAQSAGNFNGVVNIVEPSLRRAIGRQGVTITSCCTGVEAAGPGTTVYLEGDRYNDGGQHPFFVSFSPAAGAGTVMYTDFHNTGQRDIEAIFRWLITRL